ncbi:hypothetical protein [Paraburkholderia sp. RL18-085-BIA-A]|uniref:hypothetical protein n=1 Tax=Paraburkholderia sp. RL18-085-BIA-A TaxID=3031633 RepID=UPI0038B7387F
MLSNDMCHQWEKDAMLGEKISRAMNYASDPARRDMASVGGYGAVVECVHADNQTLAMLDGYTAFTHVDSQSWMRGEGDDTAVVRLLKSAAKKLGYRLVKNPAA